MEYTDKVILVQQLKKGDEKAYLHLQKTYHSRLYAYAISLINDRAMAHDMIQNVFLKTWDFRHRLDENYSIQSFLFKSLYNETINYNQKNRARLLLQRKYLTSLDQIMVQSSQENYENMIASVDREIRYLPQKCKEVFILSKKEGLTNQEIADHLCVSVKTVEAQITKAFSALRTKLAEERKATNRFSRP